MTAISLLPPRENALVQRQKIHYGNFDTGKSGFHFPVSLEWHHTYRDGLAGHAPSRRWEPISCSDIGRRIPIKVRVVKKDDRITVDLSEVSKQVRGGFNSGMTTANNYNIKMIHHLLFPVKHS